MAHTPGPWTVYKVSPGEGHGIDGLKGEAVVWYGETTEDGITSLDDANLIAAAPELLKALRRVASEDDRRDGRDFRVGQHVMEAVKAAIAKAEGRA
jgi:hypothetical protein